MKEGVQDKTAKARNIALFTYHPPNEDQIKRYGDIREQAHILADVIVDVCPESPERGLAIRRLQEVVMYANAAIAINESGVGVKFLEEGE